MSGSLHLDPPERRAIPLRIKRAIGDRQGGVCLCGCGAPIWRDEKRTKVTAGFVWDHEPALKLRSLVEKHGELEYEPHQHDAAYITARCAVSNRLKTSGAGATTAGTDVGKIKKERRRSRKPKFKRAWAKGRKLPSRKMRSDWKPRIKRL